jgi:hypothetical protein
MRIYVFRCVCLNMSKILKYEHTFKHVSRLTRTAKHIHNYMYLSYVNTYIVRIK